MCAALSRRAEIPSLSGADYFYPLFDNFAEWLRSRNASDRTILSMSGAVKHFIVWLDCEGIGLSDIDSAVIRRFFRHRCECPRPQAERYQNGITRDHAFKGRVVRFVTFLIETGHKPAPFDRCYGDQLVADFVGRLEEPERLASRVASYRSQVSHFLDWCWLDGLGLSDFKSDVLDDFRNHHCVCPGHFVHKPVRTKDQIAQVRNFLSYLTHRGVIFSTHRSAGREPELEDFRRWLFENRGVRDITVEGHIFRVNKLIGDLGTDPDAYTHKHISQALLRHLKGASRHWVTSMTTSLRMYLRYLAAMGKCAPELVDTVPTIPHWRLSTLPRYVVADDVERIVETADPATPTGARNRAILLLLARLALRPREILELRLADIDWDNAIVRIRGKSRVEVGLPLPQDVGDALVAYIEHNRPDTTEPSVFLCAKPPHDRMRTSSAVTSVVREAIRKSGIRNPNLGGAYLLRHSAATNMLRSGATMETVATLLRHRSIETTSIYAKVDTNLLSAVVQPWMGGEAC